jgi:hypothetical protein
VWGTRTIIMHCVKGSPKFSVVRKWSPNQARSWFFVEFDWLECSLITHSCVSSKVKRVFPRKSRHGDDPRSLKQIRSNNAPADSCDRVSLYLLVVSSCLTPGTNFDLTWWLLKSCTTLSIALSFCLWLNRWRLIKLYILNLKLNCTDHKPNQAITIEDVDNFLTREELDSENVIVKYFQFDIRPAQLQHNEFTSGTML